MVGEAGDEIEPGGPGLLPGRLTTSSSAGDAMERSVPGFVPGGPGLLPGRLTTAVSVQREDDAFTARHDEESWAEARGAEVGLGCSSPPASGRSSSKSTSREVDEPSIQEFNMQSLQINSNSN